MVVHDFNNQLVGMIGCAQLIKNKTANDIISQYATVIFDAAQNSADLARMLLSFSRKQEPSDKEVNIHQIIIQISLLLHRCLDRKITIHHDLNAENSFIIGNSELLENALLNLAIKASYSMPDGGSLTVSTVNINLVDPEEYNMQSHSCLKVCVSDTGAGIHENDLEDIFEPFVTNENEDNSRPCLQSVYTCVLQHNGHISVNSAIDEGTTFKMLFNSTVKGENSSSSIDNYFSASNNN